MRGDDPDNLPEDMRWAADHLARNEKSTCECSFDDSEPNFICDTCFLDDILKKGANQIERLRAENNDLRRELEDCLVLPLLTERELAKLETAEAAKGEKNNG